MRKESLCLALAGLLLLGFASAASADSIVFSSLPAGSTELGLPDDEYLTAFGFVPHRSGTVDTLTVPFTIGAHNIRTSLTFGLWSSDGLTPQTPLASFSSFWPEPVSVTASLAASNPVFLQTGVMYFLVANVRDSASLFEGSSGLTGPILRADFTGTIGPWAPIPWETTAAFALSSSEEAPIPEPATMLLIGTGLGVLAVRRRRAAARG